MDLQRVTIFAMAGCLLMVGCDSTNSTVRVIVPNGFSGKVSIVLDNAKGAKVSKVSNEYKYVVANDGRCLVRSLEPFEKFHEEVFQYANGDIIPRHRVANLGGYPGVARTGNTHAGDGNTDGAHIDFRID